MSTRILPRLSFVVAIAFAALLMSTSLTSASARPQADLIVNPGESIQAAIDAANDGDTIIINAGDYTESLTLSKPVSLTGVNSDTTIIHAVAGQRVLTVTGATISNSVVISGLTFTGGNISGGYGSPNFWGGGILIDDVAQPILHNIQVISNSAPAGGGIRAGTLTLIGSRIANNAGGGAYTGNAIVTDSQFISNTGRGGLYAGPIVTLTGVLFDSNQSTGQGAGLVAFQVGDSPVTINDSKFINNNTSAECGGAYLSGVTTIANSLFERNRGDMGGGGLCCHYYACALDIRDTAFISNTTASGNWIYGGGVYFDGSLLNITHSRFEGNSTYGLGGGLYAALYNNLSRLTDTVFISNTSLGVYGGGGGAFFYGTINGGKFERNLVVSGAGGGLFGGGEISGTVFMSNSANSGGGIYGLGTIINAHFESNQAALDDPYMGSGGALGLIGPDLTVISNTKFINNFSQTSGGAIHVYSSPGAIIVNSLLAGNTARDGAALSTSIFNPEPYLSFVHSTIANVSLNPASAIVAYTATVYLTNTLIANHTIGISTTDSTVTEDYNLFYNNLTDTVGITPGAHSLVGDPHFVDPAHADYHLAFGSAAIDRGYEAGVYTDLDGNPRPIGPGFDIGAYEYQTAKYIYLPLILK